MLKFRPIVYSAADLSAFKLSTGASATQEGRICYMAASTSLSIVVATPWNGVLTSIPTLRNINIAVGSVHVGLDVKRFFPIYREDPNIESVSATISAGDFCIGFSMKTGNEFEVHNTMLENSSLGTYTVGGYVCLGSTGRFTAHGGINTTGMVVGRCMGTFAGKYLRVRVI